MPSKTEDLPTILHRSELLAAGVTNDEIRTALRSGSWQTLHRGTYGDAASIAPLHADTKYELRSRAIAARSPHLVLSHISAASVLQLPIQGIALDEVHLTRIGKGGGRSGPGRIVHSAHLQPREILSGNGFQVTDVARTLIDVACSAPFATTTIAADNALNRRLLTPADLAAALARTQHRRGAAAGRRALLFADGRSESVGETRTRLVMHQFGLPAPTLQVRLYAQDGTFLGRVDMGYPELGVMIEFDGLVKYRKPLQPGQTATDVVIAEKAREDLIRGLGYAVVRFVWAELSNPSAMAAKINAAIVRGRSVVDAGGVSGSWNAEPALQVPR